jgi:hypothetical protein
MAKDYIGFCEEKLWHAWLEHQLQIPEPFDCEAAPEPYLLFGTAGKALVALTTNPGATMWHQSRDAVKCGTGPLRESDKYGECARRLGDFYEKYLTGPPRARIARLRHLSACAVFGRVMQVELIPFHSRSLPEKDLFIAGENLKDPILSAYVQHLRKFLRGRPAVGVQAVSVKVPLTAKTELSPWLEGVARVLGLHVGSAKFVSLVKKGSKTTVAALVSRRTPRKVLVLTMGTASLPAGKALSKLAAALGES